MNDQQAVRCLKGGNINGLESLVERYQVKAVRAAFLITRDEQMAEDVVQETFLRIYRNIRHFDEKRPFEPYLLRSVTNAALNAIDRGRDEIPLEDSTGTAQVRELLGQAILVEDEVEYHQLRQDIYQSLEQLSPRQRLAVVQRYFLNMSEKEMAESMAAAPGTVKWMLNAARQRLRYLLAAQRSVK